MTERPILFNGPMVRAILGGQKTQTRRLAINKNAQRIKPGDILWVRETFCDSCENETPCKKADWGKVCSEGGQWKPSIHMPRIYSRISLKVVSAKTGRLQDISEQDAKAEGVDNREAFISLWNSINDADGTRWEDNPKAIVIEFEMLKK